MTSENEIDRRLQSALQREQLTKIDPSATDHADLSGLAYGMRVGTEFLGGTLVGFGIGFCLDKVFGSVPWFILIFTLLGFCAGMLNVYRFIMQNSGDSIAPIGLNRAEYLTKTAENGTSKADETTFGETPADRH